MTTDRSLSPDDALARAHTVMGRLDALAALSDTPGAITRLYLSPAHAAAVARVTGWMRGAGLETATDAAGTVVGRLEDRARSGRTLIVGSHIDTVRDAGRFDGCLGVVLAIEAVAALREAGLALPFALEVVAFGDEEGVRFPRTLTGSQALAGRFDPAALDAADEGGTTLGAALRAFGLDPDGVAGLTRRRGSTIGYVEAHIEQGPVLEAEGLPVGVVSAIAGATRLAVTVTGEAGHAGTVPMRLRRDAFTAAAAMALAVEQLARDTPDLVATVGQVEVGPGAVNVIPGAVRFTVDLRAPTDAVRLGALDRLRGLLADIALHRRVGIGLDIFYDAAAAPCSPVFRRALARAVEAQGLRALDLPSGAGHDGLAMVDLCPIAMLFVRCAGGVSHNPAESVATADVAVALRTLLDFLLTIDPARPA